MEKYFENGKKLEEFSKQMFKKIGQYCKESNNKYTDFSIIINNEEYGVEVKRKISPIFINHFLNKLSDNMNYKNIVMVYDNITESVRNLLEENNIIVLDISNILYIIYKDINLLKKLTGILDYSLDSILPRENKWHLQIEKNLENIHYERGILEKTQEYIIRLNNLKKGKSTSREYEKLMGEILKEIFEDKLEFKEQKTTNNRLNVFDMISKIKSGTNDEFFKAIEEFFKTKYVVFEFKNYSEKITQEQICTTEKYLYGTALRNVGIIITRTGINQNGKKVADGILRENGKLILVLDDEDVKEMIKLYESKENPSSILMEKLDEILTKLER